MPFEVDPDDVDDDVVAGEPPDELELWVDGVEDGVDELEFEEFEPQAASPRAASVSRAAARRRVGLVIVAFIIAPLVRLGKARAKPNDAYTARLVPGR